MFAPTPAWLNPRWSVAQAWVFPVRLRHRSERSMPFTSPRLHSLALFRRRAPKLFMPTCASTQDAKRNYHALTSERFAHVPPEDTFPRTAHVSRLCVVACPPSTSASNHDLWQDFLHVSRLLPQKPSFVRGVPPARSWKLTRSGRKRKRKRGQRREREDRGVRRTTKDDTGGRKRTEEDTRGHKEKKQRYLKTPVRF